MSTVEQSESKESEKREREDEEIKGEPEEKKPKKEPVVFTFTLETNGYTPSNLQDNNTKPRHAYLFPENDHASSFEHKFTGCGCSEVTLTWTRPYPVEYIGYLCYDKCDIWAVVIAQRNITLTLDSEKQREQDIEEIHSTCDECKKKTVIKNKNICSFCGIRYCSSCRTNTKHLYWHTCYHCKVPHGCCDMHHTLGWGPCDICHFDVCENERGNLDDSQTVNCHLKRNPTLTDKQRERLDRHVMTNKDVWFENTSEKLKSFKVLDYSHKQTKSFPLITWTTEGGYTYTLKFVVEEDDFMWCRKRGFSSQNQYCSASEAVFFKERNVRDVKPKDSFFMISMALILAHAAHVLKRYPLHRALTRCLYDGGRNAVVDAREFLYHEIVHGSLGKADGDKETQEEYSSCSSSEEEEENEKEDGEEEDISEEEQ